MLTRIITGVVGIALAAFIIQTGGTLFVGAILVLMLVGWHEYVEAFRHFGQPVAKWMGYLAMVSIAGLAYMHAAWDIPIHFLNAVTFFFFLAALSVSVFCHRCFSVPQALASSTGIVYVGWSFMHLILLRFLDSRTVIDGLDDGCAWLWVALVGTWASDTFAYFAGSTFGKHKLCEAISPKKTIEGFLGGLLGTAASVATLGYFFDLSVPWMALLGCLIALVATIGDLVESAIKRYTGIKDSGNVIPGHGGVLDRFDSVMFSVPFVYYVVYYMHFVQNAWVE